MGGKSSLGIIVLQNKRTPEFSPFHSHVKRRIQSKE